MKSGRILYGWTPVPNLFLPKADRLLEALEGTLSITHS